MMSDILMFSLKISIARMRALSSVWRWLENLRKVFHGSEWYFHVISNVLHVNRLRLTRGVIS
jgi:hypothetical protein